MPTDLLAAALVPAQKTGRKTKANEPNTISTGFRRCLWSMRGSALHHPLNQRTLQTFGYSSLSSGKNCTLFPKESVIIVNILSKSSTLKLTF